MQEHDVARLDVETDEVADNAFDVPAGEELGGDLLVSARELDVRRPRGACVEERELQRPDAAPNLQHALPVDLATHCHEVALCLREAVPAVARELASSERAIEEATVLVLLRLATTRHKR
jgi:hypothetical protein